MRSAGCEQYYKASSFQHLANGNTRIFTQANQVSNYPRPSSGTTPAPLIDECVALGTCKVQFPCETLMMDMGTNTQLPSPLGILQVTNYQIPGSSLNTTFLSGGIPSGIYGDCGHLSFNFASQDLVCQIGTNITNSNNVLAAQTTVFNLNYPGSILYPTTVVNSKVTVSGKVTVK